MPERIIYETGSHRLIVERGSHPQRKDEEGISIWWEDERGNVLNHRPLFLPDGVVPTAVHLIEAAAGFDNPS